MSNRWLSLALGAIFLAGCATNPGTPGASSSPAAAPAAAIAADAAECDRRMVDEKVDLESVKGKMRRDNCLDAMKLKPQLEKFSPDVVQTTLRFAECKADARTRNLPMAQHQDALFECATKHGGQPARACLMEMVLAKVPVDALEMNMGYCLQLKKGAAR